MSHKKALILDIVNNGYIWFSSSLYLIIILKFILSMVFILFMVIKVWFVIVITNKFRYDIMHIEVDLSRYGQQKDHPVND